MITILTKSKQRRVIQTECQDAVGIGRHIYRDDFLMAVAGDKVLNPTPKPVLKEKISFFDRKAIKLAKKKWKEDIINKYPQESGAANQIWKNHLQVDSKFN